MNRDILNALTPYGQIGVRTKMVLAIGMALLFLIVWSIAIPAGSKLPTPLGILHALRAELDRGLFFEAGVSLWLNLEAIVISTTIALLISYVFVWPPVRPVGTAIEILRFSGLAGWTFVFYKMIHEGHGIKLAALVFGMTPYLVTSLIAIVRSVDDEEFQHARTLKLGHVGTTWQVIVRGRMDQAFEAVRQNAAIGWMMVTAVEGMLRTEGGLGVRIMDSQKYLRLDTVFALILVVLVIGILQDLLIRVIRNLVCPYATLTARSI